MTRQSSAPIPDDHGWLITPRALTSLATAVGLVYTLHAPVRYVMRMGADVDALNARVASLEAEIDQQRGTIAAAEMMVLDRDKRPALTDPETAPREPEVRPRRDVGGAHRRR